MVSTFRGASSASFRRPVGRKGGALTHRTRRGGAPWRSDAPSRPPGWPLVEVDPHEPAGLAGAPPGRLDDPPEPGPLERRGEADVRERRVEALAGGVDRISLDRGRAGRPRRGDDSADQGLRHAAPPESRPDEEAQDRPDREIVEAGDRPGADETAHLRSDADADPADRDTVEVGKETRRRALTGLSLEGGPAAACTEPGELARRPAVVLTPAASIAAAAAHQGDDIGPALGGRRVDLDSGRCRLAHASAAARLSSRIAQGQVDLVGRRDERRDDPGDVGVGAGRQDDQASREGLGQDPLGQVRIRRRGRRRRRA